MKELKFWKVEIPTETEARYVFRAPSTNATITVDATGSIPRGNFHNMDSDEHGEIITVLENVLGAYHELSAAKEAARAMRAAQATSEGEAKLGGDPIETGAPATTSASVPVSAGRKRANEPASSEPGE